MSLISAAEVNSIAFVTPITESQILPVFISTAETKFIVPLVTQAVLDDIADTPGDFTVLVDDYIKPYLAFAIKYTFYNQLLTETDTFPTSDLQRTAAIQEILSILEVKRDLLRTYLNENIFDTPLADLSPLIGGFLTGTSTGSSGSGSSSSNTDVTSTLNSSSVGTLSDADNLNFIQFTTGLLRKLTWANFKATLKTAFDSIYSAVDHSHSELELGVTDGMFNLDITDNKLTVAPHPANIVPYPGYAYFHLWDGWLPSGGQNLVLEGNLYASRLQAFNNANIPLESTSGSSSYPAAKFNGGLECHAANTLPVLKLHHFVGGNSACNAILLQITRDISGTVSQDKPIININDDPTSPNVTGELLKATIDSILRVNLNPRVPDGATAVAYLLDTRNSLANASAKLLSICNQGIEKLSLSAAGVLSVPAITVNGQAGVSGSFTTLDGKTITVTNGIISSIV